MQMLCMNGCVVELLLVHHNVAAPSIITTPGVDQVERQQFDMDDRPTCVSIDTQVCLTIQSRYEETTRTILRNIPPLVYDMLTESTYRRAMMFSLPLLLLRLCAEPKPLFYGYGRRRERIVSAACVVSTCLLLLGMVDAFCLRDLLLEALMLLLLLLVIARDAGCSPCAFVMLRWMAMLTMLDDS